MRRSRLIASHTLSALVVAGTAAISTITTAAAPAANAQTLIETCGQEVGGDARLEADLDCTAAADPVIRFVRSGTLHLNGHTLSATVAGDVRRIDIIGPGTITGPGDGVVVNGYEVHGGQTSIMDATIAGNAGTGVIARGLGHRAHIRIRNSSITGNLGAAAAVITTPTCPLPRCATQEKLTIENSLISGNGGGVVGSSIKISDSSFTANSGDGVTVGVNDGNRKLRIRDSFIDGNGGAGVMLDGSSNLNAAISDSSISGNAFGLDTRNDAPTKIKLKRCAIEDNDVGVIGSAKTGTGGITRVTVLDTTVLGSARSGIRTPDEREQVTLRRSVVTGSASASACGVSEACADIETAAPPRIDATSSCGLSHVFGSGIAGQSWSVCSGD